MNMSYANDVNWPESDAKHKPGWCRRLFTWLSDIGVTQLLALICVVLSAVVIGLGLVLGASVIKTSDQAQRITNIGSRVNEQQDQLNRLQIRTDQLQQQVTNLQVAAYSTRSTPR